MLKLFVSFLIFGLAFASFPGDNVYNELCDHINMMLNNKPMLMTNWWVPWNTKWFSVRNTKGEGYEFRDTMALAGSVKCHWDEEILTSNTVTRHIQLHQENRYLYVDYLACDSLLGPGKHLSKVTLYVTNLYLKIEYHFNATADPVSVNCWHDISRSNFHFLGTATITEASNSSFVNRDITPTFKLYYVSALTNQLRDQLKDINYMKTCSPFGAISSIRSLLEL